MENVQLLVSGWWMDESRLIAPTLSKCENTITDFGPVSHRLESVILSSYSISIFRHLILEPRCSELL